MENYLQQGDVLVKSAEIPKGLEKDPTENILAFGEVTGHAHRLSEGEFQLFHEPKTKQKYLRVVTPTMLKHEEHKAFKIPPGDYRIDIVKEVDPFEDEVRNVAD